MFCLCSKCVLRCWSSGSANRSMNVINVIWLMAHTPSNAKHENSIPALKIYRIIKFIRHNNQQIVFNPICSAQYTFLHAHKKGNNKSIKRHCSPQLKQFFFVRSFSVSKTNSKVFKQTNGFRNCDSDIFCQLYEVYLFKINSNNTFNRFINIVSG